MSSNTDFFAQMAAELDKTALEHDHVLPASGISPQQKMNVLNLDLGLHPGTVLADSIARICQGVVGELIAKEGGLEKLVRSRGNLDDAVMQLSRDFQEHRKFLKADILMELSDVIAEQIEERLNPFTATDKLRDRVLNFSLDQEPPSDPVREAHEERQE